MVLITKENKTYNYPINLQPSGEEFTLEVYSHMSKTTTTFTGLTGVVVDDFVGIEMTDVMLSKLPNGEYDYTVYDNDQTRVSIGLLRVDLEQQGEEDEPEYVVYHDEMDGYITIQNQDEAYEQGYKDGKESVPLVATGFTQNGVFLAEEGGWSAVTVDVPTGITPSGQIEITENGIYDVTEKASANVQVPVEDYYQSGFTDGYESGETVGYESGYTEGYSSGYTDCYPIAYDEGYDDGFEDGEESVPLNSTGFTENGSYTASTGGWSAVTVNVPTGITPTGEIAISGNGTYDVTQFASANVNVPTGITPTGELVISGNGIYDVVQYANVDVQVPVEDYYQSGFTEGYESGYTVGYESGETVGYESGYTNGYESGVSDGFESGFTSGETYGFQVGYDSGRTDGYNDGFDDGVESVPLSTTGITSNGTYVNQNGGWNEVTVNVPSVTTQTMTQAQYDALTIKDPMVIYLING